MYVRLTQKSRGAFCSRRGGNVHQPRDVEDSGSSPPTHRTPVVLDAGANEGQEIDRSTSRIKSLAKKSTSRRNFGFPPNDKKGEKGYNFPVDGYLTSIASCACSQQ